MSYFGYRHIIDYFESLAGSSPSIQHNVNDRRAFVASDITDFLIEDMQSLSSPFLVAGFSPMGVDGAPSTYRRPLGVKAKRSYQINIGIFKEAVVRGGLRSTKETLSSIDEIVDEICDKVYSDREEAIHDNTENLCFLKYLDDTVMIHKTSIIGSREAMGYTMSFVFDFCRQSL